MTDEAALEPRDEGERPPSLGSQRRRRLRIAVLLLLGLPLLLLLVALLSLRSGGVRRRILARVSSLLGADYGVAFSAADFTPEWWQGGVVLRDVRLGKPGAPPFATVERLRAAVELGSLRRRPLVVRWLEAEGLRVDLAA